MDCRGGSDTSTDNDYSQTAEAINARVVSATECLARAEQVSEYRMTADLVKEAEELFDKDQDIPVFWRDKYEREHTRNWDLFYKRNTTNFFKDRMWLGKEFKELVVADVPAPAMQTPPEGSETFGKENDALDLFKTLRFSGSTGNPDDKKKPLLVEIGCGVGNALIPILECNPNLEAIGVDCSPRAIEFLNKRWQLLSTDSKNSSKRTLTQSIQHAATSEAVENNLRDVPHMQDDQHPWHSAKESAATDRGTVTPRGTLLDTAVWDITRDSIPEAVCAKGSVDFVLLLFVLSAIPPAHHRAVACRAAELLAPGGILLFRDYGRYDMTQLRFAASRHAKVRDNFYVRQDGTLAYFLTAEILRFLFVEICGLEELENTYFLREIENRKMQKRMKRVWIQGRFRRPAVSNPVLSNTPSRSHKPPSLSPRQLG